MTSRYFLSQSLYKNCQKRLRRPILKLTRNDVDSNDFASNPKSDLLDVLASYPLDRTCFIAVRKTFYSIFVSTKIRLEYYTMLCDTKCNIRFLFRINVSSAEH